MAGFASNTAGGGADGFSPGSTRVTLEAACREAGFNARGASLLRLGENALYCLKVEPVVVRIARTMDYWRQVENEVAVAGWLEDIGYSAARVVDIRGQPMEINGHPVTFWRFIDGRNGMPNDVSALARLLREFHRLPKPGEFDLPQIRFDDRVERRLETAPARDADKSYLLAKFRELCAEVRALDFPLAESAVHGDAHIKNVMISESQPILIDFEGVGWGHPEWDLAMTATEYVTAKWWSDEQYATFAESYGFDIRSWSGFDVVRQVQEIKMTTWLMQNVNQSSEIAAEFDARMRTIRTGKSGHPWKPY